MNKQNFRLYDFIAQDIQDPDEEEEETANKIYSVQIFGLNEEVRLRLLM